MANQNDTGDIKKLLEIMATLRDPRRGCPWDLEQSFATIAPYTIEEAYEVAEAIERGDLAELAGELGDLLFQVVFHARLAEEQGAFDFAAVTRHICEKMIRRHPHVFADAVVPDAAAQTEAWEAVKHAEKAAAGREPRALEGVPAALPALTRAVKLGRRAARAGFDWPELAGARAKLEEELAELDEAAAQADREHLEHEVGDVLFAVANVCRHLNVDPEQAARGACRRFEQRFGHVEERVRGSGRGWESHSLAELEAYWTEAKEAGEKAG